MASFSELAARINDTPFMRASHIRVTHLELDRARGVLEVHPESLNPHGFVHGGMLTALADTLGGVAASTRGGRCVTVNNTMSYLRPAVGSRIYGEVTPVRVGRTITVMDASLTDEEGRLVAKGTFTFHLDRSQPGPIEILSAQERADQPGEQPN